MPEDQFAAFEAIPGVGARLLAMYPELATLPSFDLPLAERLTRQLFEWLLPELEKITLPRLDELGRRPRLVPRPVRRDHRSNVSSLSARAN